MKHHPIYDYMLLAFASPYVGCYYRNNNVEKHIDMKM